LASFGSEIEALLSAKRQFQLFCSERFHGLADILERRDTDMLLPIQTPGESTSRLSNEFAWLGTIYLYGRKHIMTGYRLQKSILKGP
jgi:hypothetical protein